MAFYLSFKGRVSRKDYWLFLVAPVLVLLVGLVLLGPRIAGHGGAGVGALSVLAMFLVAHSFVSVKRLHDSSKSGWWAVPFHVGVLALVGLIAWPNIIDFSALATSPPEVRAMAAGLFSGLTVPAAFAAYHMWFTPGKDGKNRYGYDPLYR